MRAVTHAKFCRFLDIVSCHSVTKACTAESLASWPAAQRLPSVFERRRQQSDQERVVLLETLLVLLNDESATMPAEAWLRLASSMSSTLYARRPSPGAEGTTHNAQELVSSVNVLHLTPVPNISTRHFLLPTKHRCAPHHIQTSQTQYMQRAMQHTWKIYHTCDCHRL